MAYVTLHAAWMLLAVAVGTAAGYLGLLRATQGEGGKSPLPGRFHLRAHVGLGAAYYGMLYAGILFGWVMHEFLLHERPVMPPSVRTAHAVLAGAIAVLYGAGWWVGAGLQRKPAGRDRGRPRLHMALNFTACTLIGVQIALAAYYVWIWPNL